VANARHQDLIATALQRLRARPDVAAASRATLAPLQGTMTITTCRITGHDSLPALPGGGPFIIAVDGDYFETVTSAAGPLRRRTYGSVSPWRW
jgi:hypothetical protein